METNRPNTHVVKNVRVQLSERDWKRLRQLAALDGLSLTQTVGVGLAVYLNTLPTLSKIDALLDQGADDANPTDPS